MNIDVCNKNLLNNFIDNFLNKININQLIYPVETLFYLAEMIGIDLVDEDIIQFKIEKILNKLIPEVENQKLYSMGMLSDLGIVAFSIDIINSKTQELNKLSFSIDKMILDYTSIRIQKAMQNSLSISNYDCVSGVSGVLNYLLEEKKLKKLNLEQLNFLIKYLISLTSLFEYKGYSLIGFFINNKNLLRAEEKKIFRNGYYDLGLAHGILSSLVLLSKAYYLGFNDLNVKNSIVTLFEFYKKYEYVIDDVTIYPTHVSFEDYISGKTGYNNLRYNSGWCYGNLSVLYSLMRVSIFMSWKDEYLYYKNRLLSAINIKHERYNLTSPVLCHGYASVITEQLYAYEITKDKSFLMNINANISALLECYNVINKKNIIDLQMNTTTEGHENNYRFLEGCGGIFLTFLRCIYNKSSYGKILMLE